MGYPDPWQAVLERTYKIGHGLISYSTQQKKSIEEATEELFNRLKKDWKLKV